MKITSLARYLDKRRPIDDDLVSVLKAKGLDVRLWRFFSSVSEMVRRQIFVQAAKGIEELEKEVLKQLDTLINAVSPLRQKKSLSWDYQCSDPVIVGFCIRRLALQYRRTMERYKQFGDCEFILFVSLHHRLLYPTDTCPEPQPSPGDVRTAVICTMP